MYNGSSISITSGTGSYGPCCARTLLKGCEPVMLVVYSRDEVKQNEMQHAHSGPMMRYFIGEVVAGSVRPARS